MPMHNFCNFEAKLRHKYNYIYFNPIPYGFQTKRIENGEGSFIRNRAEEPQNKLVIFVM